MHFAALLRMLRSRSLHAGVAFAAFVVAALALVGCDTPSPASSDSGEPRIFKGEYPIRVVATTGMVADLVRAVGGEHADVTGDSAESRVEVTQLLGAGVDPHLYKATRDDVQTIAAADVVFYNGLMLEGKMADTLVKIGRTKPVYAVTESLEESVLLTPDGADGHHDPHVWMDVEAWSRCVDSVADALATFDPPNADRYRANAKAYQENLAELHAYAKSSLATIPKESRVLVTSHDAFNYFGRAYDLEVLGIQGLSTESEAGLARINALVDLLEERNVQAVFVESSVPTKSIEALIDGANSRGHEVKIGGELFSDAMGEGGTYEGTYVGMIDFNVTTVTRALGGEAPAGGMQGKLSSAEGS